MIRESYAEIDILLPQFAYPLPSKVHLKEYRITESETPNSRCQKYLQPIFYNFPLIIKGGVTICFSKTTVARFWFGQ
jgi:hypothetical protein